MNKSSKMGIIAAGLALLAIGGGTLALNQQDSMDKAPHSSQSSETGMAMGASRLSSLKGDAFDEAFINEMVEHHTGAVAMAELVDTEAKNPDIQKLAKGIIATQTKEINDMKAWSEKWGYEFKEPAQAAIDEMTANLVGKSGDALDEAFLTDMIGHHNSAIDMAVLTANNANHAEIKTLGKAIESTQTAEIKLMKDYAKSAGYSTESGSVEHGSGN